MSESAENTITLSALVVGGIFAYRKAVEPGIAPARQRTEEGKGGIRSQNLLTDYQSVFGAAPPIEWGQWIKAAGFMFITISLIGAASPEVGSALALLVATSAVVGNGVAVMKDLHQSKGHTGAEELQEARTVGRIERNTQTRPTVDGTHITYPNLQSTLEGQPGSLLAPGALN